jgi:hypothetical protein
MIADTAIASTNDLKYKGNRAIISSRLEPQKHKEEKDSLCSLCLCGDS